jgi:hypothetical protein
VLDCRLKEATCVAGLGRTREALARFEALLPAFERVHSVRSDQTLNLRRTIGQLLAVTGQAAARPFLSDLLVDMRNVHGDEHPDTQSVRDLLNKLDQLGE